MVLGSWTLDLVPGQSSEFQYFLQRGGVVQPLGQGVGAAVLLCVQADLHVTAESAGSNYDGSAGYRVVTHIRA